MSVAILEEILATKTVIAQDGITYELHSAIDPVEGAAIVDVIENHKISRTLEIGCAYGVSSLYICDALSQSEQSPSHTIIDPFQTTDWHGIGVANLCRAGFHFYSLIEKPSEIALAELLATGKKFEFILIDGVHTFDHTLLDFFYADRLLEIGGFVAIDDILFPGIRKVASYISNYPNYRLHRELNVQIHHPAGFSGRQLIKRSVDQVLQLLAMNLPKGYSASVFSEPYRTGTLNRSSTMKIFQKTGPDTRQWDWYFPF